MQPGKKTAVNDESWQPREEWMQPGKKTAVNDKSWQPREAWMQSGKKKQLSMTTAGS
jgi:transposase